MTTKLTDYKANFFKNLMKYWINMEISSKLTKQLKICKHIKSINIWAFNLLIFASSYSFGLNRKMYPSQFSSFIVLIFASIVFNKMEKNDLVKMFRRLLNFSNISIQQCYFLLFLYFTFKYVWKQNYRKNIKYYLHQDFFCLY